MGILPGESTPPTVRTSGRSSPADFSRWLRPSLLVISTSSVSQSFQAEIAVFDLHRRADVDFHSEETVVAAAVRIVVDQDAHNVAVEDVDQGVATRDQVNLVPVVIFDEGFQRSDVAEGPDHLGFLAGRNMRDLAAHGIEGPAALL